MEVKVFIIYYFATKDDKCKRLKYSCKGTRTDNTRVRDVHYEAVGNVLKNADVFFTLLVKNYASSFILGAHFNVWFESIFKCLSKISSDIFRFFYEKYSFYAVLHES